MQEEFAFHVDAFKLPIKLRQHSFKKLVKEVHSPLDLSDIVCNEMLQEMD
jgi:hypothetical protein